MGIDLSDEELLRYSRQVMLPQVDVAGQEALKQATVLIIGLGGLGSPAALYLGSAGVGHLILVDDDVVDITNLQRQIAHETSDTGTAKTESAAAAVTRLNPNTKVTCINRRLDNPELEQLLDGVSVVLDCSDNFTTRFALNRACIRAGVPLVSGAAIRFEGQVTVFDSGRSDSPCYRCLYGEGDDGDLNCSENGVVAPLVGVIGSYQALEAIKLITGAGKTLTGRLLVLDGLTSELRILKINRRADCPDCHS